MNKSHQVKCYMSTIWQRHKTNIKYNESFGRSGAGSVKYKAKNLCKSRKSECVVSRLRNHEQWACPKLIVAVYTPHTVPLVVKNE